ncbi:MAG: cob(I)yrinic acid a,c-diamide adenosyltransferase [Verrucomicrobia bacterium]|nr:MAG: cob(I)yrinic acid a,c-diamide adenosyltransferase [Verrucomicrobiota bacterium]TAE87807.1 MAG: cob(I)yrinic acid a,c-diamide adenosyltransferase [Verrucomicrobiota bacterium]TAF25550.1 MAG: cob(I)yrinic acid a,c-diamide adenosyltransferase [Verrucomicrobiota bacterium]TAF41383.1 MAG: cob(I)yrinic acid a,c-diamide adenosyltransferase [Verrucomicrobiota bacterium]
MTGRGDEGDTDLLFGRRIAKTSRRVAVLGAVDELNAALGLARAAGAEEEVEQVIDRVQELLVGLMGQFACQPGDEERYEAAGFAAVREADLDWLVAVATDFEKRGVVFKGWARPGAEHSMARAGLDFARTVARRAERAVLELHESGESVPGFLRLFFNRLSDLLWILARKA